MSYYKMYISGTVNISDYNIIHDYISILGKQDELELTIKNSNEDDIQVLCNILEMEKFNVILKGGLENGKFFLKANRKR